MPEERRGTKAGSRILSFSVNGKDYEIFTQPNKTLLEVLREDLRLTGTKKGCGTGECGLCTVLVDEIPVLSCLTLALLCQSKRVTTVEGLSGREFELLQTAFIEEGATQCGYCTPSLILVLWDLLKRRREKDPKEALSGNFCRCTGYVKILRAYERTLELRGK